MKRIYLSLAAITLLTATVGCRMCAHPYDYCGPLFTGDCGSVPCDPCARAGSILGPPLYLPGSGEVMVEGEVESRETIIQSQPMEQPRIESLPPEVTRPVSRRPANYRTPTRYQSSTQRGTTRHVVTSQRSPSPATRKPQTTRYNDSVTANMRTQIPKGAVILSETDAVVTPAGSNARSIAVPTTRTRAPIMQASTGWQRLR